MTNKNKTITQMIQDDTNDYIASLIQVRNDITRGLPEARSQQDIAPVYEQSYVFSSRPIPPTLDDVDDAGDR